MAYIDRFGDVFYSYYMCEGCGLKVPAQMLDRTVSVKAPKGNHEVGVVELARGPICQNPRCPGTGTGGGHGYMLERVHHTGVDAFLERHGLSPTGDTAHA